MIYWNNNASKELNFEKYDLSGLGENRAYDYFYRLEIKYQLELDRLKIIKKDSIKIFEKDFEKNKLQLDKIKNVFDKFTKCLDKLNINYSINYRCDSQYHIYATMIVLYYPEIIITNGKESRKLLDFYFCVEFNHESVNLLGGRGTYFIDEYISKYTHSHLPRGIEDRGGLGNFCLGSGVLSGYINLINSYIKNSSIALDNFNLDLVTFIVAIKPYLEWESLAGGPYISMSQIGSTEIKFEHYSEIPSTLEKSLYNRRLISNYKYILNLDWKLIQLENNFQIFKLVKNEKLLKTIKSLSNLLGYSNYYKYKVKDGKLYCYNGHGIKELKDENYKYLMVYNQEIIRKKVIPEIENATSLYDSNEFVLPHKDDVIKIIQDIECIYNYYVNLKLNKLKTNNETTTTTIEFSNELSTTSIGEEITSFSF